MVPRRTAALRKNGLQKVDLQNADSQNVGPDVAARDNDVDFGPLEDWVGFHLRMAQIASFQSFARRAHGFDLSPGRFATLVLIDRNPGISQTALSHAIGSDKSTLTPVLDHMVKQGWVSRERTQSDRRLYELNLTLTGRKVMRAMQEHAQRHESDLDAIVGSRERAAFLKVLRKIAATRE